MAGPDTAVCVEASEEESAAAEVVDWVGDPPVFGTTARLDPGAAAALAPGALVALGEGLGATASSDEVDAAAPVGAAASSPPQALRPASMMASSDVEEWILFSMDLSGRCRVERSRGRGAEAPDPAGEKSAKHPGRNVP